MLAHAHHKTMALMSAKRQQKIESIFFQTFSSALNLKSAIIKYGFSIKFACLKTFSEHASENKTR